MSAWDTQKKKLSQKRDGLLRCSDQPLFNVYYNQITNMKLKLHLPFSRKAKYSSILRAETLMR